MLSCIYSSVSQYYYISHNAAATSTEMSFFTESLCLRQSKIHLLMNLTVLSISYARMVSSAGRLCVVAVQSSRYDAAVLLIILIGIALSYGNFLHNFLVLIAKISDAEFPVWVTPCSHVIHCLCILHDNWNILIRFSMSLSMSSLFQFEIESSGCFAILHFHLKLAF